MFVMIENKEMSHVLGKMSKKSILARRAVYFVNVVVLILSVLQSTSEVALFGSKAQMALLHRRGINIYEKDMIELGPTLNQNLSFFVVVVP